MEEFEEFHNSSFSSRDETFIHPLGSLYPILKGVLSTTLITLLVIIMLAMGCVITWTEVYYHLRRPVGVVTGMLSQFLLLPLVGYGIAHALQLSPYHSIGLLVLTCSPGGTTSNIFTYFTNGDVSLSIVMTTASTVLALGFMPLNLLIYTPSWTSDHLIVPYEKISVTLILILIPVVFGMLTRWKLPKIANIMSKTGSAAGLLAIISTIILQGVLYPTIFNQPWKVWFSCIALPVFGFTVGYVLSRLFRQESRRARTVAIETGAQNVSLALTVLILSFPSDAQQDMSIIPLLFSIFVLIEGFIFCFCYKIYQHYAIKEEEFEQISQSDDSVVKNNKLELIDSDSAKANFV